MLAPILKQLSLSTKSEGHFGLKLPDSIEGVRQGILSCCVVEVASLESLHLDDGDGDGDGDGDDDDDDDDDDG